MDIVLFWTRHGHWVDKAWTLGGRGMDIGWTRHGHWVDKAWTLGGQGMPCPYGYVQSFPNNN